MIITIQPSVATKICCQKANMSINVTEREYGLLINGVLSVMLVLNHSGAILQLLEGGGCCWKYIDHTLSYAHFLYSGNNLFTNAVHANMLKEGESQHRVVPFYLPLIEAYLSSLFLLQVHS